MGTAPLQLWYSLRRRLIKELLQASPGAESASSQTYSGVGVFLCVGALKAYTQAIMFKNSKGGLAQQLMVCC